MLLTHILYFTLNFVCIQDSFDEETLRVCDDSLNPKPAPNLTSTPKKKKKPESSAKQRERDSAREMKLPASDALQSDVQPVKKQGYLICRHGLETFIIFGSETL